jgi:hypothetical protein
MCLPVIAIFALQLRRAKTFGVYIKERRHNNL